ncbi:MAG: hypothetical protein R3B67_06010 [Phycisphaerales bacterium]
MVAVALEVEDGVDHVLEHAWAGEGAFFGDMPDEDDGGAGGFGEVDEFAAAAPELGDGAGGGFEVGLVDHLDGVDDADIGLDFAGLLHDAGEVGVGEDEEVVAVGDAEA